jgi:CRP-like cAMP-binding protein
VASETLVRPRRTATLRQKPAGGDPPRRVVPPNRLLAALPAADCDRIFPLLRTVPMRYKQVLQRQDEPVSCVYFPAGGVASLTTMMRDGRTVEVATVGNEGMIGIWPALGGRVAASEAIVQVPGGSAQAMPVELFRKELARRGGLHDVVTRYVQAFLLLTMQSAACNGLHTVEQRCSRWLLMAHDRTGRDEFRLTQETLAVMLGVRRPSVTDVAGALRDSGRIDYRSGRVRIVDRKRLEAASCECYRVIRSHFRRLLN